jgi:hypothetical protein
VKPQSYGHAMFSLTEFVASTFAPYSSSVRVAAVLPLEAATCSGVQPFCCGQDSSSRQGMRQMFKHMCDMQHTTLQTRSLLLTRFKSPQELLVRMDGELLHSMPSHYVRHLQSATTAPLSCCCCCCSLCLNFHHQLSCHTSA